MYVVMYHYVRDLKNSRYPAIKGLDLKLFCQQIEFFLQHFSFVNPAYLAEYLSGDMPLAAYTGSNLPAARRISARSPEKIRHAAGRVRQ